VTATMPPDLEAPARRTAIGTLRSLVGIVVQLAGGAVLSIYLPRALGPESYGLFAVAASVALWVETVGCFPFSSGLAKLIADAEDRWRPLARTTVFWGVLSMGAVAVLNFALAPTIAAALHDPGLTPYLRLFVLDYPFFVVFVLLGSILNGRRLYERRVLLVSAYWIGKPVLTVALVAAGLSIRGAVLASIGASVVAVVFGWRAGGVGRPRPATSLRPLWAFNWPLVIGLVFFQLSRSLDMWLVKTLLEDARAPAYYAIAVNLHSVAFLLATAVAMAAFPTIANAVREGNRTALLGLIGNSHRFVWILGLGMLAVFVPSARAIVTFVFGPAYAPAALPASILLGGVLALATGSVATNALVAAGRPRVVLLVNPLAFVVSLALYPLLIPRWGVGGAAAAAVAGFLAYALLSLRLQHRVLKAGFPGRMALRTLAAAAAVAVVGRLWPAAGAWTLLEAATLLGLYLGLLWALREIGREDLAIVARAFRLRRR